MDELGRVITEDGTALAVVDDRAAARFEATVDGEPAGIIDYAITPPDSAGPDPLRTVVFLHTETFQPFGGHGIAAALTRRALTRVRAERGAGVLVPRCPFTRQFVVENPEFTDLLVPDPPGR